MGTSVLVRIILLVSIGSQAAEGVAAVHADLMRREPASEQVLLSSSGDSVSVQAKDAPQKVLTKTQAHARRSKRRNQPDYCDWDFPLGKEASNDCANSTTDSLLVDYNQCAQAAKEALLGAPTDITEDDTYKWVRPYGCFLADCVPTTGTAKPCYFWNGVEGHNVSEITKGKPVCKRDKVVRGTPDFNPSDGCPPGYTAIVDEATCLTAGSCVGEEDAEQDLINNFDATLYDHHPLYCFLGKTSGGQAVNEVYFNKPLPQLDPVAAPPTTPALGGGTPVCNVSSITFFPNGEYPVQTALNHYPLD